MGDRDDFAIFDKIVLTAGGSGGLGRAVSLAFLAEGAELIVTYQRDRE